MIYCCHRINTLAQLKQLSPLNGWGIEIDLRDNLQGEIYIAHDPFVSGELFEDFLKEYKLGFIILNIKSERIEYKVLELIRKYNISDYFFLDSSFPMIYKLSGEGEKNIAIRFSEYEGLDTVLAMKDRVKWVWIDCFSKNPLTKEIYHILKEAGFKLCFVSPDLQQQENKIVEYRDYFVRNNIELDMICTKVYNIDKWTIPDSPSLPTTATSDVQIVIPMSGLGQRFIDAGYKVPKPLIEVDGKPIIEHVVNLFPGSTTIKFICNDKHLCDTDIHLCDILHKVCPGGKIYEVPVEGREGPVHAVSLIFDEIAHDKEVIVSYCDYGTDWDYNDFLRDTRSRGADGAVACYRGFHPHMLGADNYAFLKETEIGSRFMSSIQEKRPFTNDRMNEYASNGTYYFKTGAIMKTYFKKIMDLGMKVKNEYYVSMVYNLLVADGLLVNIYEIDHMLQWGTPYDLEIYNDWSRYFRNIIKTQEAQKSNKDIFNTTLILPMAGAGSRFSKKGYTLPKPLIDVNGKPMIVQAVNCLPPTSYKVFVCLEEHLKKYAIDNVLKNAYSECKIKTINYVTQGQACTTEIGINDSRLDLKSAILISACDNGVYYDNAKYQTLLEDDNIDIIVWTFRNNPTSRNNPNMYAWLETDENNYIKHVSCKKFMDNVHNVKESHVIIGTMFFRKAKYFIDGLAANYKEGVRSNGEYYVDDVINQNIKQGLKVKAFEVENYICWGTPDDYETYCYWQRFFNKCSWHPYSIEKDVTH